MRRAASIADTHCVGREESAILCANAGWQFCLMNAKRASLVIDQAPWTELGNGKEAGALQVSRLVGAADTDGWHKSIKRQPRKIIAGQKAFGRQIAISVEIGSTARGSTFKQSDLFVSLHLLNPSISALFGAKAMHFRTPVRLDKLRARTLVKLTPPVERAREPLCRPMRRRFGKGVTVGRPGRRGRR